MKNKRGASENNGFDLTALKPMLIGVAVAFAAMLLLLLAVAVFMTKNDLPSEVYPVAADVCAALGSVLGGFVSARLTKRRGLITGALVGGIVIAVLLISSVILGSAAPTVHFVLRCVIVLSAACVGGVFGVNVREKSRV